MSIVQTINQQQSNSTFNFEESSSPILSFPHEKKQVNTIGKLSLQNQISTVEIEQVQYYNQTLKKKRTNKHQFTCRNM